MIVRPGCTEESPALNAAPMDLQETVIWEEEFSAGEFDPALDSALQEKFGPAGRALMEGAAAGAAQAHGSPEEVERGVLLDQLVKVNRRLQRRNQQQCHEFEQQHLKLLAANRAKDVLLSRTGHDIRNGIGSVLAHTTLAAAEADPSGQLDNIEETCQQLLQLLDALVDQAALASGAFSVRPMAFPLEDLIASVAGELRDGRLRRKDQGLLLSEPDRPHVVHADPQRITQVIRNLLENASKFAQSGTDIEITVDADDGELLVEILDRGPGLPEGVISRLFEPLAPVGNEPTNGEASSGLGLPVVSDIIQRHGGRVWGRNRMGGGAAFGFSLPRLDDDGGRG